MSSLHFCCCCFLLVLLSPLLCINCEPDAQLPPVNYEDRSHGKRLNILLLSDAVIGHLAPVLALGQELVRRGHNVTQFLPLHEGDLAKYTAHVEKYGVHVWNVSSEHDDDKEVAKRVGKAFFFTMVTESSLYAAIVMKNIARHVNKSLSDGDWNLVIGIDYLPVVMSCLSSVHKVPFVYIAKLPAAYHLYPSWPWPSFMYGAHSDDMNFIDRLLNTPYNLANKVFVDLILSRSINSLAEYCPSVSLSQALTDIGVRIPAIVPTAIGFEYPRTISPMIDYVGALIPTNAAPLSGELEEWLGGKPDRSVVYVSMGSMCDLDEKGGWAIIEGVMETNYSMLWSLRKSNQWILQGLQVDPDRVLISDWTPQFSVLGSKAVHSAILHGGFNGLHEALWNGVPIIVFPQMFEQIYNAGRVHFNELGIHLNTKTISSSKIAESLRALDTGEYRSKVEKIQKAFRIAGGVKRAADLVEFYEAVGYAHLVPAYAKYQWSWVQYYNADVYAVMLATLVVVLLCLRACCKCICKRCSNKNRKKIDFLLVGCSSRNCGVLLGRA